MVTIFQMLKYYNKNKWPWTRKKRAGIRTTDGNNVIPRWKMWTSLQPFQKTVLLVLDVQISKLLFHFKITNYKNDKKLRHAWIGLRSHSHLNILRQELLYNECLLKCITTFLTNWKHYIIQFHGNDTERFFSCFR